MGSTILHQRRARLHVMARGAALYRKNRPRADIVRELFEMYGHAIGARDLREMESILVWRGTNGGFDFRRKFEGKSPAEIKEAFLKWYHSPRQNAMRLAVQQLRQQSLATKHALQSPSGEPSVKRSSVGAKPASGPRGEQLTVRRSTKNAATRLQRQPLLSVQKLSLTSWREGAARAKKFYEEIREINPFVEKALRFTRDREMYKANYFAKLFKDAVLNGVKTNRGTIKLNEREQNFFILFFVKQWSLDKITSATGCNQSEFEQTLKHALGKLFET